MRLLVDSNVIVSGLLRSNSSSGQLMQLWLERRCEWLTCDQQIEELNRVIAEPYIMSRVEGSFGSAYAFMRMLHLKTTHVLVEPPYEAVCRDPDDDYLIALLSRHPIDFLISGDKNLLALKPLYPKILTPRVLIDRL